MPHPDLDPTKLGTVTVRNGKATFKPHSDTSDDDAALIRASIRELNKRVRAGELKVNPKGKVTTKNGGK